MHSIDYRDKHHDERVVVLGNGPSRKLLDLEAVYYDAITIGCNAIIRDGSPHYVVGSDIGVLQEWARIGDGAPVYVTSAVPPSDCYMSGRKPLIWHPSSHVDGMLNGEYAILWAVWLGCNPIYVAGFDCDGRNIYANTPNYRAENPQNIPESQLNQSAHLHGLMRSFVKRHGIALPKFYQFPPHTFGWMDTTEVPAEWLISKPAAQ